MEWEQPHWSGRPQSPAEPRRKLRPNHFARLARFAAAKRYWVIAAWAIAALLCAAFAAATLTVDPGIDAQVTLDDRTAAVEAELDSRFPGIDQTFLAIINNRDSDAAKAEALKLAAALSERSDLFASAFVPGTGAFYDTNAMLFRGIGDIRARVDQVLLMQPLYHALAAAPDVQGLAALVTEIARAVDQGRSPPGLAQLLAAAAATIEADVQGVSRPIDWPEEAGLSVGTRSPRWFVVATPRHGAERHAAALALQASSPMLNVRWLWPRRALGAVANPLRDFLVPGGLSLFVTLTLLAAGLGSLRMTIAVAASCGVTVAIAAAVAAAIGRTLGGATWSFAGAAIAPAMLSGIVLVLARMQARAKSVSASQSIMLATHRRGAVLSIFAAVFAAVWLSWLMRHLPSVSQFAMIALAAAAAGWAATLTLLPALMAMLGGHRLAEEPHWLDEALAEPSSYHVRNVLDVTAMLVIAAAVFSAAFLPGVRLGERHLPTSPSLFLDTPDARGALHILVKPEQVPDVVRNLARLPEIGAIRTIDQFLPRDAEAKIAELRRLEGLVPILPAPRPPAGEDTQRDSFARLEEQLTRIATSGASSEPLREAALRLRRSISLYTNPQMPGAGRVLALEDELFAGLGALTRTATRLARLRVPAIGDLDARLLNRFVSADGLWRVEVMPKPGIGLLSFAAAVRRLQPQAAGEPITALASNEIIHHETLLALAVALVGTAILTLAALRNPLAWIAAMLPAAAFITLTAAVATGFDIVLNSAMLAAASTCAAVLICCSVVITEQLTGGNTDRFDARGTAIRAGLLPPVVLAGAVAPLAVSTNPQVAELGGLMALLLLIAAFLCLVLLPPLTRWFGIAAGRR